MEPLVAYETENTTQARSALEPPQSIAEPQAVAAAMGKVGHLVEIDAQASTIVQALCRDYQQRALGYLQSLDDPALYRLSVARLEEATHSLILAARTDPTLKTHTLEALEALHELVIQMTGSMATGNT